jgi:nucleoside-diphosphate-sugar epimerase
MGCVENLKALITGATGFIGSNLLRALVSNNFETHVTIRKDSNIWRIGDVIDQVEVHYCDLADQEKVKQTILETRPQLIFHLATYGATPNEKEKGKIMNANFMGTINLVDACVESGFECFINTGSSSEYGTKLQPMREMDVLEPLDDYGVSKAAATLYCQSIAKNHDLNILTLRLFSPYGYFEDPDRLVQYLIRSCLDDEPVVLYHPKAVRDFIFIEDVVNAYLNAVSSADKVPSGEIFNVGSGKQHSVRDIFNIVKRTTRYEKKAIIGDRQSGMRPADNAIIWEADITKIKKALGWEAKTTLPEGIKKTVAWFKDCFLN